MSYMKQDKIGMCNLKQNICLIIIDDFSMFIQKENKMNKRRYLIRCDFVLTSEGKM